MDTLNRLINGFAAWERPWLFYEQVSSSSLLPEDERNAFTQMWNEATDGRHWMRSDLVECGKQVQIALLGMFPNLDASSAKLIANAAAYEWR